MNNLINGKFYWVKSTKVSQWEIARFERKVRAYKNNDAFFFTNGKYQYLKDCFEIAYEPILRNLITE